MQKPIGNLPFIKKLRDSYKGFLQLLVTEFTLTKRDNGVIMELRFSNTDHCIDDATLKKKLNRAVEENLSQKQNFTREFSKFVKNEKIRSYTFSNPEFPLRHANGGVLPIIRYKGKEYFCLFLRTIFPQGWNIANGGSNNKEELYNPELVVYREFSEELIIKDDKKKILYIMDSDNEKVMCGTQEDLIELLSEDTGIDYKKYERLSTPLKWLDGPDKIIISDDLKKYISDGFFVNITPDDNAIELDKIAYIKLDDEAGLLDGEVVRAMDNNKPKRLNRIIGLFETDKLIKNINNTCFKPDLLFYNGVPKSPRQLENTTNHYLESVKDIWEEGGRNEFKIDKQGYNFCPVTRKIIERYIEWLKKEKTELRTKRLTEKVSLTGKNKDYQVFISFKSQDAEIADALFDYLKEKKLNVFSSNKSLEMMGESAYAQAIDLALEASLFLIVVSSKSEYFNTGWVQFEWRTFINEIHSGRKVNGQAYTLTSGISVNEIPIALRQYQNFIYQKSDPYTSFQSVYNFIKNKL